MAEHDAPGSWPELDYRDWAATRRTLHLFTQLAGKIRLALEPVKPEWMGTPLYLTGRGLTTGAMPWGTASVEAAFDFFDHDFKLMASNGAEAAIAMTDTCVADFFHDVLRELAGIGLRPSIWSKPQEVADTTRLDVNQRDCVYVPDDAAKFFQVLTAAANVFDSWRSRYFARTGVQFWWGSFDLSVILFNGRKAEPPPDAGYILKHDLDAEFISAGFWPGDDSAPAPIFYGYIYPQPPECHLAAVNPEAAAWVERMGEWVVPYEKARNSADPGVAIISFLDSLLRIAGERGGWDLQQLQYVPPPPSEARRREEAA